MKTYDVPKLLALLDIDAVRKGREYEAKCPIHNDHNPSWQMQAETGLWHCWSCQEGGGAVDLVRKVLNIGSIGDVYRWMESNGVIDGDGSAIPTYATIKPLLGLVPKTRYKGYPPGDYWPATVRSSSKSYLRSRGITDMQSNRWHIECTNEGILAGRIIFPMHDRLGNLCGFMARSIDGRRPRYLTPEPDTNPDRTVIFGENGWPIVQLDKSQVVVTEGAINALACERAGARYIAALGGSNLGLTVYSKLAAFGHVIVASDPDRAGEHVAMALQVLKRWTKVTRVDLPAGLDAAKLSKQELQERLLVAGMAEAWECA